MPTPLSDDALNQTFRAARTRNGWTDEAVPETLVRAVYDLARMGPTSANCSPARFVFVSKAARGRLLPLLMPSNADKTMNAPWTVIVAYDPQFYDKIPQLFPHNPGARDWFSGSPELAQETAVRNGTLQGAYLMIAARMLGLDCGPMSGFNKAGVDAEFLAGTGWKSDFLCNIGHGNEDNLFPRSPRLSFEEACLIV
jgi:3-hydroxypropanoate dehydrogenase